MLNIKFKRLVAVACVLLLQPMLNPGSLALARKKSPPKAYSFIAEGGKASQAECDGVRKIPRLKRLKEFSKYSSYMGSELQSPEIKGKAGEEMWTHHFRAKDVCNTVLAKTPSALAEATAKAAKPELPPDDSVEEDDESEPGDKSEQADKEEKAEKTDKAEGPDSE